MPTTITHNDYDMIDDGERTLAEVLGPRSYQRRGGDRRVGGFPESYAGLVWQCVEARCRGESKVLNQPKRRDKTPCQPPTRREDLGV